MKTTKTPKTTVDVSLKKSAMQLIKEADPAILGQLRWKSQNLLAYAYLVEATSAESMPMSRRLSLLTRHVALKGSWAGKEPLWTRFPMSRSEVKDAFEPTAEVVIILEMFQKSLIVGDVAIREQAKSELVKLNRRANTDLLKAKRDFVDAYREAEEKEAAASVFEDDQMC